MKTIYTNKTQKARDFFGISFFRCPHEANLLMKIGSPADGEYPAKGESAGYFKL